MTSVFLLKTFQILTALFAYFGFFIINQKKNRKDKFGIIREVKSILN